MTQVRLIHNDCPTSLCSMATHQFVIRARGVKIIRDILKKNPFPNGSQLFHVTVQQPPSTDFPANLRQAQPVMPWVAWAHSYPGPIRSVRCVPCFSSYSTPFDQFLRFLKPEVLPVLANSFEIKKACQPRLAPVDASDVQSSPLKSSPIVKRVIETGPINIVERDRQRVEYIIETAKRIKAYKPVISSPATHRAATYIVSVGMGSPAECQ